MKKLLALSFGLALIIGAHLTLTAKAACIPVVSQFPTSLDTFLSNQCVPSAWANELETLIGINGSADTNSLQYKLNNISSSPAVAGGNGQIQFNNSGTFGANANYTFSSSTGVTVNTSTVGNLTVQTGITLSGLGSAGTPCLTISVLGVVSTTTCGSTNIASGTVISVGSPLLIGGSQTSTIVGDGTNSILPYLNSVYNVPLNYSTVGCAGSSTATDFGACINAISAKAPAQPSYIAIIVPPNIVVPQANWHTPIVLNTFGVLASLDCPYGARLSYGGTGRAVTFNSYNSTGHLVSDDYGCTYMGQSSLIAAGQVNTATTTGIFLGGSNGQPGIVFEKNNVNGFVSLVGGSSTIRIGTSANASHGCYELYDSVNTSTLEYLYTASNVITATTTKPAFCQ